MALSKVAIRMWRMSRPEKGPGMFVWFDPDSEVLELFAQEPPKDSGVGDYREGDDSDGDLAAPCSSNHELPLHGELPF